MSLDFYVAEQMSGRELHPSKGQDVNQVRVILGHVKPHSGFFLAHFFSVESGQMGGDILIDNTGTVTLPYYSKTNTDRPTLQAILDTLRSSAHKKA